MSNGLLRGSLATMIIVVALSSVATGQTTEKPPKKQTAEDPFAEIPTNPIPLTTPVQGDKLPQQTVPKKELPKENIDKTSKDPTQTQAVNPFKRVGSPVERVAERPSKDPNSADRNSKNNRALESEKQAGILDNQTLIEEQQNSDSEIIEEQELPPQKSFEEKFWEYLKSNAYENWAPAPGQDADFYQGRSPHGDFLKMYLNRTAAASPQELPNGSIIVKENYAADRDTLMAITVMYRSKGYNAEAGDWYWIKYLPDGKVATTSEGLGDRKIMGKPKSCIECHGGAADNDFTFFNDK